MSSSFASSSSSDSSVKTIVIAGIECDVYGLEELKGDKVAVIVSSPLSVSPPFSPLDLTLSFPSPSSSLTGGTTIAAR